MKVFVWKSYGEISVHAFESDLQIINLKEQLVELLNVEGSGVSIGSTWRKIIEEIDLQISSRSDMFESGTGFYNLKE